MTTLPNSCENGQGDTSELCNALEKILSLKNAETISKQNVLKELLSLCLNSKDVDVVSPHIYKKTIPELISILSSATSEKCRELSANILTNILSQQSLDEDNLSSLLNVFSKKLCKTDEYEKSEEIRLLEMNILYCVLKDGERDLLSHLNNLSSILSSCIVDEYPDVKRRSCECLCLLAVADKNNFHMVASTFLKPLLQTISHRHLKTRSLCIKAIGTIVDYLNNDEFMQVVSHLSQRLFDCSPIVRLSTAEVIGDMLVNLKDRYSYFPRLIPLMLSLLYDEVEQVRAAAMVLWTRAGSQYLEENEKDYKDLMDFPQPDPLDYPSDDRPSLGTRTLVQRHLYAILPPLVRDLKDWQKETRSKSCSVLHSLVLRAEEKVTMQVTAVLEGIISVAADDELALSCAELLGYFVEPNLLVDTILSLTFQSATAVHLSVLAAALRGMRKELECFSAICKFLADPSICRMRQPTEQANLLLCIKGLMDRKKKMNAEDSYQIFCIIVSVKGLSTTPSISEKATELLLQLQKESEEEVITKHAAQFLDCLAQDNELWSPQSPEAPIFIYLVESGLVKQSQSTILSVCLNNLHPSQDPLIRGKILRLLPAVFPGLAPDQKRDLFRRGLLPNLQWAAGKTACSLREVAALALMSGVGELADEHKELLPILQTLSEDESPITRLLSIQLLTNLLPTLAPTLPPQDTLPLHRACHTIALRGLDDVKNDVRVESVRLLKTYVTSFGEEYDWRPYRQYVREMFGTALVHMDDGDEGIRKAVYDMLKAAAHTAPDVLLEEAEAKKYAMSNSNLCEDLISFVKNSKKTVLT